MFRQNAFAHLVDYSLVVHCQWCLTLCSSMGCNLPGFPVLHYLLEFAQIHVHCVGDAIQPSRPLLFPSPFALKLSEYKGLFQWVSSLHQVVKNWISISASDLLMNIQGSFPLRIDWFDLLAIQGTLMNLLQCHNSKASVHWRSAFFFVQLSHLYVTTGKTIALTIWTFVGKVMSL